MNPPTPWGLVCESLVSPSIPFPAQAGNPCGSTGCCHPLPRLLSSTPGLLSSTPFWVFQSLDFLFSNREISSVPIKRFPVFQSRDLQCSNQEMSCAPIKTSPVPSTRHFLRSNEDTENRQTNRRKKISVSKNETLGII